jgi:hypothetical protein
MAESLSAGNVSLALLEDAVATEATLVALILTFGPISGSHFNPAATIAGATQGGVPWRIVPGYIMAQCAGGCLAYNYRKSLAPAVTSVDRYRVSPSCEMQNNPFAFGHELRHSREPSGITLKVDRVNPGNFEAPLMAVYGEGQGDSVDAIL